MKSYNLDYCLFIFFFYFLLFPLLLFSLSSCSKNVHHNIDEYILELETNNSNSFNILQLNDIHLAAKDNRDKEYDFNKVINNEEIAMIR